MNGREVRVLVAVYLGLWATLLGACALTTAVPGLDATVRARLDLQMVHLSSPSRGVVAALVVHNASIALWPLAAIAADLHRWRLRALLDGLLAVTLMANAGIVGAALSAYGTRLVRFLPHLPLEFLGLALPATSWMLHRAGGRARALPVARRTVVVLTSAALIEAYAT